MRIAGASPSKTTLWRRRKAAEAAAVVTVAHEDLDAFIGRKARELGLGSRDWPKAKGAHRRLVMGDGATLPSRDEALPAAHDPCCAALDGSPCDCCEMDVEQA